MATSDQGLPQQHITTSTAHTVKYNGLPPSTAPSISIAGLAKDTTITGGNFIATGRDLVQYNITRDKDIRQVINKIFKDFLSLDITYDSKHLARLPPLPPIGNSILQDLDNWANQSTPDSPSIVWVHGPAGVGKTAIAISYAKLLSKRDQLAASFFFPRDDERDLMESFIPSLAYQISVAIPQLAPFIAEAAQENLMIFGQSLETQMKRFIVEPIAASNLTHFNQVVVIDGLDGYEQPVLSVMTNPDIILRLEGKLKFLICSKSSDGVFKELAGCPAVAVKLIESSNSGFYVNSSLQEATGQATGNIIIRSPLLMLTLIRSHQIM